MKFFRKMFSVTLFLVVGLVFCAVSFAAENAPDIQNPLVQIWEAIKPVLIAGIMPLVSSVIITIIGFLIAWLMVRFINLSKHNSKFNILWMIMVGIMKKQLSGAEKKAEAIAKFHVICRKGLMNKLFGRVSDEMLDAWIEAIYNGVIKGIAPLPNVQTPILPSLK